MPALRVLEFEVEGRGPFPLDMLRYDGCFPVRSEDASSIGLREPECYEAARTIRLRTVRPKLTPDRWRSFGWKVRTEPYAVDR